jgi:acyl-CoA synthetase (AMP-forming)/AMP-acid ligase II
MNFTDKTFFHATTTPEKAAIVLLDRGITYRTFVEGIQAAEDRIRASGFKPGDLIGIATGNPIRHLTLVYALYRSGIASVSLRHGLDVVRAGIQLAAVLRDKDSDTQPGARDIPVDEAWFKPAGPQGPRPGPSAFRSPDEICRVSFSSGTTGYPKGIGFTVKDIEARLSAYSLRAANAAWDRMLCLPGLSTNYGFSFAQVALTEGKTLGFAASARETLQMVPRYTMDLMVASTQQLRDLVDAQSPVPVALPSLRAVHVGGNVMSQAFLAKARAQICGQIICAYGSTEAGTVAHAPSEMMQSIEGAVGIVAPWAEVQAVDERGAVMPRGQAGIIRIRAEGQGRTYGKGAGDKDDNFKGGWFYPGDRGMVTAGGMLVILGRSSELINAGGAKVAPELVEEVLLTRPEVKEAAALAMMGPSGIEELWVAVVPNGPIDERALIAYCGQKNADLRPARVKIVTSIPRSALGKVARDQLRQQLLD